MVSKIRSPVCQEPRRSPGPSRRHLAPRRNVRVDPGEQHYLWRAVDQDGEVLDIRVQKRRDTCAAQRCFHKLLKGLPYVPCTVVTDRLGSYGAACRDLLPRVVPRQGQRLNNRAGVSHQRTRQRERHMRCFKSPGQAQHFLVVHGPINNLFGLGRHLLPARHYRTLRTQAVPASSHP